MTAGHRRCSERLGRKAPRFALLCLAVAVALSMSAGCTARAQELPAAVPDAADYRVVFSDDFSSAATIAASPADDPAAKWYRAAFFGFETAPAEAFRLAGGVLHIEAEPGGAANLHTAAPAENARGWAGRAFRNGGYFEARMALGPDRPPSANAWPAFWLMAIEHMASRGAARWQGQPSDFMRFAESDIFEYNPTWQKGGYIATMHEWYGRWQSCERGRWCHQGNDDDGRRMIRLNPAERLQDFHVYGQLWVPATRSERGYVQNFLDGQPVGLRVEWDAGDPQPPAPARLLYNVMDRQGMVLTIGTGEQRLSVDWVRVWQKPGGVVERR